MSNTSISSRVHPVVAVLDAVDNGLDGAADAAVWALTDTEDAGHRGRVGRRAGVRSARGGDL